jgi:hypothetical protein
LMAESCRRNIIVSFAPFHAEHWFVALRQLSFSLENRNAPWPPRHRGCSVLASRLVHHVHLSCDHPFPHHCLNFPRFSSF